MVTTPTARQRATQPRRGRKTAQVILRVTPEQKDLFQEAAIASGRTITDFATEALQEKALQIVRNQQDLVVWRLSRADALAFAEAVLNSGEPDEQMRADYAKYLEMKHLRRETSAETGNQ